MSWTWKLAFVLAKELPRPLRLAPFVLLGLGALTLGPGVAQTPPAVSESPELLWRADRPLGWEDFWGSPPPTSLRETESAKIWIGLTYFVTWEISFDPVRREWVARLVRFSTQAYMDRARSWALPDHRQPELLRHEQGHFDILEVFRRWLEKDFQRWLGKPVGGATREDAERELGRRLEEVYLRIWAAHEACQAQYDEETRHGQDLGQQDAWARRIALWLGESPLSRP